MKEDSYSDIRPYNDDEIPAALERIVNDPFFIPAVNFAFPDADMERIREVVRTCKTVDQMQERVMFSIIKRIILCNSCKTKLCKRWSRYYRSNSFFRKI